VALRELSSAAEARNLGRDAASGAFDDREPRVRAGLSSLALSKQPAQAALTALLAWSMTVAPAAFARASSSPARVAAVVAIVAGIAGPLLVVARPRLARGLGLTAFLTLATVTWLLASVSLHPDRLDPVRASLGSLAWGLFALSWRAPRPQSHPTHPRPTEASEPLLEARARLPRSVLPIAALSVVAALTCVVLAWRTREVERALLAQAVALVCATALASAGTLVALQRRGARLPAARGLQASFWRALAALVVLAVGAAIVWAVR
jgi:hypothetical protein